MKVLHICNDFNYQKLYINLFKENSKQIDQIVYCGGRNKKILGRNIDKNIHNIEYHNPLIVFPIDKINYFGKAFRQFNYIRKNIDLTGIDYIHSHTLLSDGFIALLIHLFFKIPFLVSVRNTDVNIFFKYKPYLIPLAKKICRKSKALHFPASTVKNKFEKAISRTNDKSFIIPNPIHDFWIQNQAPNPSKFIVGDVFEVCFVGKIDTNKNVMALVKAIEALRSNHKINLTIVGKFYSNSLKRKVLKNRFVNYISHLDSKVDLMKIYRESHLLCLPSKRETFGLVCIEALSQGTPFLMREEQGLFGMVDSNGWANYFKTDREIKKTIQTILLSYDKIKGLYQKIDKFKTSNISQDMLGLYQKNIN